MIDFEDQLRAALQREQPSSDFTRKVMQRAAARQGVRLNRWRPWIAGSIAASLALATWGLTEQQHRRERRAHEQLMLALRIASAKLLQIEKKVGGLNR